MDGNTAKGKKSGEKKSALGKGLDALLPGFELAPREGERLQELELSAVSPNPDQPRRVFDRDKLKELAESIRAHGVMQPLLVTPRGEGYLLAAGERRWRAAKLAGLTTVPCLVREMTAGELAEISLIENIQREDLSPLEEASAYQALLQEYGYTQEQLASRLGKSRPYIANTLRLLQLAPQEAQALREGKISAGHARTLLSVEDGRLRGQLFAAILKEGLSVRQAEELARRLNEHTAIAAPSRQERREKALLTDLERQLTLGFGLPARLQGNREKGRLVIEYNSGDDLQNILDRLGN